MNHILRRSANWRVAGAERGRRPYATVERPVAQESSVTAQWLHQVLTSAPAMRFKCRLRDLVWALRAPGVRNPPWPARVDSLLFVCYGNICRSPFAARLAALRLEQARVGGVRCTSAGFRTSQRATSPADAVAVARRYQVDLQDNRPTLITDELVRSHDVVFVMEPGHLAQLRRRWPTERGRFFLLPSVDSADPRLGPFERLHFVDPFGRGEAAFVESYARIARAVDRVVTLCAKSRG